MLAQLADQLPFIQYGALGLCFLLVIRNWREGTRLSDLLRGKDEKLERKNAQIIVMMEANRQALQNNTDAVRRLSEALEDRPCLKDDQRLRVPA